MHLNWTNHLIDFSTLGRQIPANTPGGLAAERQIIRGIVHRTIENTYRIDRNPIPPRKPKEKK